jgi:hypothetical protein
MAPEGGAPKGRVKGVRELIRDHHQHTEQLIMNACDHRAGDYELMTRSPMRVVVLFLEGYLRRVKQQMDAAKAKK